MATIIGIKKSAALPAPLRSAATLVGIKSPAVLANYLRGSHNQITQADRAYLADYIEGKIKRPNHRPKSNLWWFKKLPVAATIAECYLAAWRKKYGRKHKVTLQNGKGKTFNLRAEACKRAADRFNKSYGDQLGRVTEDQIAGQLMRPRNLRR